MTKLLPAKEINKFLKQNPNWVLNHKGNEISRVIKLDKYIDGLILIARMAVYAEIMGHHPDITFTYGKLKVKLSTHDLNGISKLDTDLATKIEDIVS